MSNLKLERHFFIVSVIGLLAVLMATPAGAGDLNWKLKGEYAWTSSATCASASCGFDDYNNRIIESCLNDDAGNPLPAIGISYNYAIQGKFSFDGLGNFEFLNGEVLSIMLEPYPNPATDPPLPTSPNFMSPIHHFYSEGDGIYTVELIGDEVFVKIVFENFTPPTRMFPNFKGATFRGRLTSGSVGSMVFLTSTSPAPENVLPSPTMQRICNAFGSMVKLSPQREVRGKE